MAGSRSTRRGRKLYTEEINAAVRGAKAAGATEIGHGLPRCRQGVGLQQPRAGAARRRLRVGRAERVDGGTGVLEQGCDAALFIGMHAKAGTPLGVMSHTISGRDYRDLRFNGTSVGETGVNAALCGTRGCPVVLVTGDDVVPEAADLLGPSS